MIKYDLPTFSGCRLDYFFSVHVSEIDVWNCVFILIPVFSTAGITLGLFGGVRKHSKDHNKVPVRGDIHVIVVGTFIFFFSFFFWG
jgi:hypothetical protein